MQYQDAIHDKSDLGGRSRENAVHITNSTYLFPCVAVLFTCYIIFRPQNGKTTSTKVF